MPLSDQKIRFDITKDDLSSFANKGPVFVTFGETLIRDTPADTQRLEMTRQAHVSLAGSEYTLCMTLARSGIPTAYITRVPDNPYGWMVRDIARSQGINTDFILWAPKAEPIGRFLYELGRSRVRASAGTSACTPRPAAREPGWCIGAARCKTPGSSTPLAPASAWPTTASTKGITC
ncbi:MAG: 2-dehydro-3-deoxygluconokinase [Chloroflexi bacterium]|nr:2-dehydro-3-deoxygluconokinase [Chloroflexota bacterium]